MGVRVPALAVSGVVRVAGSAGGMELQVVPTLDGISVGVLEEGASIRLSGSGIPEGGAGAGEEVIYGFGAVDAVDSGGQTGADVFSALAEVVEIDVNVPVGATGTVVTVSTAGGTASFDLADVSLNGMTASASSGTPGAAMIASANVGQRVTVLGEGFDSGTRVRFSTFDGNYPQYGVSEREVVPVSVAPDGTSLEVVVPDDAVTGVVRLADEPGGLILQVVPTLSDIDITNSFYDDTATLRLTGSGFVEGAQTLILGSAIGAGGAVEVQDLWDTAGANAYRVGVVPNAGVDFGLPVEPPFGPVKVRTLGGSSEAIPIGFTGIAAGTVAERGTPANEGLASANVREEITLEGVGFDSGTEVIFPIWVSNRDEAGTQVVAPSQVAGDGTSLKVVVPDDAVTGEVRVVGAEDGHYLQIVPTIVQVITPSSFSTGSSVTIQGSGFIENDVIIGLGETYLLDTGSYIGPNVYDVSQIGAGLNRYDNDGISFSLPPGASAASIIVRTSGGEATLVSGQ